MNMKGIRAKSVGCFVVLQLALVMVTGARAQVRTKPSLFTGGEAQEFQELRCRGGAGLRFILTDGRTPSADATRIMIVDFQPAAQPPGRSGSNLQPGQCSFPERVVQTNEPHQIVQEIVYFAQLKRQLHGDPVDTSPTAAEKYPDAQNVPKYLSDAKHYWIFFVRQTGPLPSGQFEASNGRAWKFGKENEVVIPNSNRNKDRGRVVKPD